MSVNSPYPVGPLGVYLENLFEHAAQLETDLDELDALIENGEVDSERSKKQRAKIIEARSGVRSGLEQVKDELETFGRGTNEFLGSVHELLGQAGSVS